MSQLSGFPTLRPAYILKVCVYQQICAEILDLTNRKIATSRRGPARWYRNAIAHITISQSNHFTVGETSSGSTFVHYVCFHPQSP